MTFQTTVKIGLSSILITFLISGCKSTLDKYSVSTCKVIETNIVRCNQLIADDLSYRNAKTVSSVNEGDL